jgi:hypothetical protein
MAKANGEYTIEKAVPLPRVAGRQPIYPFGEMEIGDSFVAAGQPRVRAAAYIFGRNHNKRFASRVTPDGIRVWRIA